MLSDFLHCSRPAAPNLFGNWDQFRGRQLFRRLGWGRDGFGMIPAHYMYCALYFYHYYIVIYNEIMIQLAIHTADGRQSSGSNASDGERL